MLSKKLYAWVAFLILISILVAGCGGEQATAPSTPFNATLSEVTGTVTIKNPSDADFSAASNGSTLEVQGQIATGENGRARLDYSDGNITRLGPNTSVTIKSNEQQSGGLLTTIKLEAGRLWIALKGGSIDVETPSGLASVRGSNLMVWVDPATQNVHVSCFEGDCGAENSSKSLDLTTGFGTILYHVETGNNPPPPEIYQLSWQDFQDWAANNPDVQDILPSIIQTLTAIPTFTFTPTATATSTFTPIAALTTCFTLTAPASGSVLPEYGEVVFSWGAMPGAAKYEITFTASDHTWHKYALTGTTYSFPIGSLGSGGTYNWKVEAFDAAGKSICTAPEFTFKKPDSPTITPTPLPTSPTSQGMGDATFEYEYGPTGTYADCNSAVGFTAVVTDPKGIASITVYYQSAGGLIGSFPLAEGSAEWTGTETLTIFYMQGTVTWYFGAVDGSGNFEKSPNSYQFMCQGLG
jgi:hypothetical protein